jgi:predicted trehalose synthase
MADLSSLIRLHKHELDEKRRALAELYSAMAELERRKRDMLRDFEREKEAMSSGVGDVHFTFASYAESVMKRQKEFEEQEARLEERIEKAKDSMMETFSEMKKYQMTQDERERLEEEERAFKESQDMDAIAVEGFRRKNGDE